MNEETSVMWALILGFSFILIKIQVWTLHRLLILSNTHLIYTDRRMSHLPSFECEDNESTEFGMQFVIITWSVEKMASSRWHTLQK